MSDKTCPTCNGLFEPVSGHQKYCKPECRQGKRSGGHKARAAKNDAHDITFIGVDGEGVNGFEYREVYDEEMGEFVMARRPTHDYVLLSVGDQSLHKNGEKLTHTDIFEFLWECYLENPNAVFVGFFLGYDFTHWFRSLPAKRAFKLLHKDGIESRKRRNVQEGANPNPRPWPVWVDRWEIDILANKRFMLRPNVPKAKQEMVVVNHKDGTASTKPKPRPWMYICDAGSFFQCAFLKAIKPPKPEDEAKGVIRVVSDEEYATIKRGKERRADAGFDPEMIEYNILENEVLARLMTTVNEGFLSDGIKLARQKWFGPGQAAQEWMKLQGLPTGEQVREIVPEWARDAGRESYYGGWFEIFAHGIVRGKSYGYDINSAYPHAIAGLPCLLHGKWRRGKGRPTKLREGSLRLIYGRVTGKSEKVGPAPFRADNGNILRPQVTIGWYWHDELEAGRRAGVVDRVRIDQWIDYDPCRCKPPVDGIRELYEGRLRIGKNTPSGKGKKLVYNSAYGKFAQSIGQPKYANPLYASRITSVCRTMILDAIATHPHKARDLLMIATDGIYFRTPHPNLDIDGERLGAWDETVHEDLTLFMPGVYWDKSSRERIAAGDAPELKSRGVSAKDLSRMIEAIDQQWAAAIWKFEGDNRKYAEADSYVFKWPEITLPIDFQMLTAKSAITQGNWHKCGQVDNSAIRRISSDPINKRSEMQMVKIENGGVYIESFVWPVGYNNKGERVEVSTPYDRAFGEDDRSEMQALRESMSVTPDGEALALVQQAVLPR